MLMSPTNNLNIMEAALLMMSENNTAMGVDDLSTKNKR